MYKIYLHKKKLDFYHKHLVWW